MPCNSTTMANPLALEGNNDSVSAQARVRLHFRIIDPWVLMKAGFGATRGGVCMGPRICAPQRKDGRDLPTN